MKKPTKRRQSIRTDRLYVVARVPGISGFQRWDEREYRLVTGINARNMRSNGAGDENIAEFTGIGPSNRLLLEHEGFPGEPQTLEQAVLWLQQNPWKKALFVLSCGS